MPVVNWAKNITFSANEILTPTSLDQVRKIAATATNLHAVGSRHSFNDIADSSTLISLESMPADLDIDRQRMTATIGASVRYGILAQQLEQEGLALHNMGSLPHISVGGATATATHGSGNTNQNLSTAISGLEIVTSEGDVLSVGRDHPDFSGLVVHLGALGIVTRLTLDLQPTFRVCQEVSEDVAWEELNGQINSVFGSAYSVSLFTSFRDLAGVLWRKHRLGNGEGPESITRWGQHPSTAHRHPVDNLSGEVCTPQLLEPGPWCERLPHFRLDQEPASGSEIQTEYMVDLRYAEDAIAALRDLEPRFRDLLIISEIRTIAADDLWLSTAYDTQTVAFHFSWYLDPAGVQQLLPDLEAVLEPFSPRPHWGKAFNLPAKHILDRYPKADAFRQLREQMDPRGAFISPYLKRVGLV